MTNLLVEFMKNISVERKGGNPLRIYTFFEKKDINVW